LTTNSIIIRDCTEYVKYKSLSAIRILLANGY